MAAPTKTFSVFAQNDMKITKMKLKKGQKVSKGTLVCLYTSGTDVIQKLKSSDSGIIAEVVAKEGGEIKKGAVLFTVQECNHPTVMKDMCADCGADLRIENSTAGNRKEEVSASVAMVHSIPELIVSEQLAQELGKADEERLIKTRKLVLLVDLDQTLIHTTNDNIPANLKDVHHYQLWHGNQLLWYHTRLRPQTETFLKNISQLFELHICTFGSRIYAHTIAKILDPEGKYFSHRILSRDECFNAQSKTANLKALFPCGDAMVCIIDDREDVWHFSPNLVHVKPYRFFQGTADINAPPGLTKTEHDSEALVHRVRKISQSSTGSNDEKSDEAQSKTGSCSEKTVVQSNKKSNDEKSAEDPQSAINPNDGNEPENVTNEKETKCDIDEAKIETGDETKTENVSEKNTDNTTAKVDEDSSETKTENVSEKNTDNATAKVDQDSGETKTENVSEKNTDNATAKVDQDSGETKTENVSEKNTDDATAKVDQDSGNESDSEKINKNTETEKEVSSMETNDSVDAETDKSDKKSKPDENKMKGDGTGNKESGDLETDNKEEIELIEWDDEDDYLFYLEEILKTIHSAFYKFYDQIKDKGSEEKETQEKEEKPSLKSLIPYIKKKVLKGCNIVFSGVIPTNMPPEKSRAYIVAKALGANIHTDFKSKHNEDNPEEFTTHLVAARPGTSKVRTAMKYKHVKKVNPDWLWSCSERWEKVEESLFPIPAASDTDEQGRDSPDISKLQKDSKRKRQQETEETSEKVSKRMKKVDSSDSLKKDFDETEVFDNDDENDQPNGSGDNEKKRNFSMSYNPMLAFSDDDLAYMDKEVEDEMDDDNDESSEDEELRESRFRKQVLKKKDNLDDSSSEDSLTGNTPRGWGLKKKMSPKSSSDDELKVSSSPDHDVGPEYESETDQDKFDKIMDAFGPETENSEDEYQESIGSVDEEIADAVMKEFLS